MKEDKKEKSSGSKIGAAILIIITLAACCFIYIKYVEPYEIKGDTKDTGIGEGTIEQSQVNDSNEEDLDSETEIQETEEIIQKVYLSDEQMNILSEAILSSDFINDLPNNGIIALKFYDFAGEERIWLEKILVGKDGFLENGEPDMTLMMHAKYIIQLDNSDLCTVITSARTNGEMWVESEKSDTSLIFKYSGMMKYKDCLGF